MDQAAVRPLRCVNLGCGRSPRANTPEERWRNVDVLPLPGVDEQVDLFAYPWPWERNSIGKMYCRHLLEHVPHTWNWSIPVEAATRADAARLSGLDGFFAFFAEAWRVLAPGGTITCEVPWPLSFETISDPSHVRFITPQTVAYLTSPETAVDYALPFRFEVVGGFRYAVDAAYEGYEAEAQLLARREWNVIHFWEFTLRKAALEGDP